MRSLLRLLFSIMLGFLALSVASSPTQASLQNVFDLEDAAGNATIEGDSLTFSQLSFNIVSVEQPLHGQIIANPDALYNFQIALDVYGNDSWSPYPQAFQATIDFTTSWNGLDAEISNIDRIFATGIGELNTDGALLELSGINPITDPDPTSLYFTIEIQDDYFLQFGSVQSPISSASSGTLKAEAVPIPGAIWLLASGVIGIAGLRRKIKS